jgi:adenylate cyclase
MLGTSQSRLSRWRIPLRPVIVATFVFTMFPLLAAMVWVLYSQNSRLAVELATDAMQRASRDAVISIQGLLDPIARTVNLSAGLSHDQWELLRQPEIRRILFDDLEQLPALYSVYYGFASNGSFVQAVRLPPGIEKFGPNGFRPPSDARFVIRVIDDARGKMEDEYSYYARWGQVVGTEHAPDIGYDPRQRPWYRAAIAANSVAISNAYVFSGTNRPGVTLSRQIKTIDGALLGVFGADLSTDTLSRLLDQIRIGSHGIVFILDRDGRLIGYPDPNRTIVRQGDRVDVVFADAVADPLVAGAVRRYAGGSGQFRSALDNTGEEYLVSFTPVQGMLGDSWTVGVIADPDEFVAPMRRASLVILAAGSSFLLLACIGIILASRLLTRPIAGLTHETTRIRRLELEGPVQVKSNIAEIASLTDAISATKAALRSFGRYVPRELVREIVEKGSDAALGGKRRSVTILFTDLADFTKATEALSPEDVLANLSRYFEVMSQSIHDYRGTIDKFIGDAVMGLWNAPADDDEHAEHACVAALACRTHGEALNAEMQREGLPIFHTRFGVHTGIAVVGNVGSTQRMQYTALGAAVNLASRVEGLNKRFGTDILITEHVEAQLRGEFLLRPLGQVVASGTSVPISLYELLGTIGEGSAFPAPPRDVARARDWAAAYSAYRDHDWRRASGRFQALLQSTYGEDAACRLLLEKCKSFLDSPPVTPWDIALVFEDK